MPDATECWLVEYVDTDKRTVFDRFANVNEAIPCLHRVLASGQRPRLYRETPITLTIDVGGEAPVKSPRRRRKKEAKEGAASPQAAETIKDAVAQETAVSPVVVTASK